MAGTKEIKRRIKSIRNTKKITKAMELVAASKMKRAVASALASRMYSEYSWQVLTHIARSEQEVVHPLFVERPIKNILVLLVTSNRGLCGAYNAQVIKKILSILKNRKPEHKDAKIEFVAIGKKGDSALRRVGQKIIASFIDLGDSLSISKILPVSQMLISDYSTGKYDKVFIAYTNFISPLVQKARVKQILPISQTNLREFLDNLAALEGEEMEERVESQTNYLFEGNKTELLSLLAEKLTRIQLFQTILESNASEQSARMVAMKNASEASGEMIDDLTLVFNKARQANITKEISEISAGMASVS